MTLDPPEASLAAALLRSIRQLREQLADVKLLDDTDFDRVRTEWIALGEAMKEAVFTPSPAQQRPDRLKFELAQGAQSIQFMIDLLPYLHRFMREHYERQQPLALLDIGAGSGAGCQLLAQLHSDIMIWSRLSITAIDHVPWRQRWVAMNYPRVDYRVMPSADLPSRHWDLVVCSHVIEHLPEPAALINDAIRACRGFAFIYAPFAEHELSPGHVSVITEATFARWRPVECHVVESMGFYGDGRRCVLAIFDCRSTDPAG